MSTCPECGSEVADQDLFCPYCGISLRHIAGGGNSEIDEFASTVIIDKPGVSAEAESSRNSTDTVPDSGKGESGIENVPSGFGAVPTPAILKEFEQDRSGLMPEPRNTAETAEQFFSPVSPGQEVGAGSEGEASGEQRTSDRATGEAGDDNSHAGSVSGQGLPNPDSIEILKPAERLENSETSTHNSIYDSVRIVDTHSTPAADVVPFPGPAQERARDRTRDKSDLEPSASKGHTAPNIGLLDTDGRKGSKLKPLEEGAILNNRYEIIRKIGGGGMGAVYLASDNNLGGVLRAVKEMVQAHIEEEQQIKAIEDFRRESMILSQLDHPSIPTIYDYFYDES